MDKGSNLYECGRINRDYRRIDGTIGISLSLIDYWKHYHQLTINNK